RSSAFGATAASAPITPGTIRARPTRASSGTGARSTISCSIGLPAASAFLSTDNRYFKTDLGVWHTPRQTTASPSAAIHGVRRSSARFGATSESPCDRHRLAITQRAPGNLQAPFFCIPDLPDLPDRSDLPPAGHRERPAV